MLLSNLDRRVLATLKDGALGRVKPGLRIAVLGNCHSLDLTYAMQLLNVGATVHRGFGRWLRLADTAQPASCPTGHSPASGQA